MPTVGCISTEGIGKSPSRGDLPANDTNEDYKLTIVSCAEPPATSPRNTQPSVSCTQESTPTKHRRRTYPAGAHPPSTLNRKYAHPTPNIEDDTETDRYAGKTYISQASLDKHPTTNVLPLWCIDLHHLCFMQASNRYLSLGAIPLPG